jgi:hypothetical protein
MRFKMVMLNTLSRKDGILSSSIKRPRKFRFKVEQYDIAIYKKRQPHGRYWIHVEVWHGKRIAYVDLVSAYADVTTVMSADTRVGPTHQGQGVVGRVYEKLLSEMNVGIVTDNQSQGAIKLWRRLAANDKLNMYFVDHLSQSCGFLFASEIFEVHANRKGQLAAMGYDERAFDPYKRTGGLLLVYRGGPLDQTIQRHIDLHRYLKLNADGFRAHDKIHV